jgi:HEPN domain-containing protein
MESNDSLPGNPTYLLYFHSVELQLKAFLLAAGTDGNELRKLGHDIRELRAATKQRGLAVPTRVEELIAEMPKNGSVVDFRYFRSGLATRFVGSYLSNAVREAFRETSDQAFKQASYPMPDWY